jgi:hypothetical protein
MSCQVQTPKDEEEKFYNIFPRWGDYPEKLNLSYISYLIQNGEKKLTFILSIIPALPVL